MSHLQIFMLTLKKRNSVQIFVEHVTKNNGQKSLFKTTLSTFCATVLVCIKNFCSFIKLHQKLLFLKRLFFVLGKFTVEPKFRELVSNF